MTDQLTSEVERLEICVSEQPHADNSERFKAEWPDDDSRFYATGETRKEAITTFLSGEPSGEVDKRSVPAGVSE